VESEDGIVAEVRIRPTRSTASMKLSRRVATDVVEPVQPVGHVFETASRRQLPQFEGRHPKVRRVLGRDVAVLVQSPGPHPASIGIGQAHWLTPDIQTVLKTVRFCHRSQRTGKEPTGRVINYQAVDADGVRAEWVEAVAAHARPADDHPLLRPVRR